MDGADGNDCGLCRIDIARDDGQERYHEITGNDNGIDGEMRAGGCPPFPVMVIFTMSAAVIGGPERISQLPAGALG